MIFDELEPSHDGSTMVDPLDMTRRKTIPADAAGENLLTPILRRGQRGVRYARAWTTIRVRVQEQLALFHDGVKRFVNPHRYPVGLERGLHERKTELILKSRGFISRHTPCAVRWSEQNST